MVEIVSGMFCFVTVAVSLIYGTRIAWMTGKKCNFKELPENRIQAICASLPAASLVYFCGFLVFFSCLTDGIPTIIVMALTSAVLLAVFVLSMAMPELKRKRNGN